MLTSSLINENIPRLQLNDSVAKALLLIRDYKLTHLPIVSDSTFMGLVSEEDLLDIEDPRIAIENMTDSLVQEAVKDDVHFLNAVALSVQYDTNVVPVVNDDNIYKGVIKTNTLLKALGHFSGAHETGGIVVLEMERSQFSISEIGRLVEESDCTILHMNTTIAPETGILSVTLHLNKNEIGSIISAFERYDYNVVYYLGRQDLEQEIQSNYKHLMNYLDL